jgi:V-type H+-transporting ATPase proteolipid subunit
MVLALLAQTSDTTTDDNTPYFFAYMGIASALVFANLGAAYGTAKSGVGIASLGVIDSSKVLKGLIPIIMAGILGIYGVIISVLLIGDAKKSVSELTQSGGGYKILGAGLSCGLSSLASGLSIGVAGDAGVRAFAQTDGIYVGMILLLIFSEAIGLYGFIVAILIRS